MPAPPPAPRAKPGLADLDEIDAFDEIIDARSPGEFAEDHLPGAINLPVLDDAERARVGTIHAQESAFAAKKLGAALVSRNIARHLETHFAGRPRAYRPLIYCWRGGSRSGSLTTVLRSIGWNAAQLIGGHKAYRRAVVANLAEWPDRFRFIVVCGRTGVGKSRFLRALAELGAQVLDLEELAAHMGSVLGAYPERPQPSQKYFESLIWDALRHFDPARIVYVESESKKIGNLHTPEALLQRMRASSCLHLSADIPVRVTLLKEEYAHFLAAPDALNRQLDCLRPLKGHETVNRWMTLARESKWDTLVAELLLDHYDPAYERSLARNYMLAAEAPEIFLGSAAADSMLALARQAIDLET